MPASNGCAARVSVSSNFRPRVSARSFSKSTEYFKELRLSERIHVRLAIAGLSQDSKRFCIRHEIYKEDGRLAARHEISGSWIDLTLRKLTTPPPELGAIFAWAERTEDFQALD